MGLDVTAYSHLTHIGQHPIDPDQNEGEPGPWCYHEDHVQAFAYDTFPQSFRGVPILSTRQVNASSTFLEGGCYAITDKTETHAFRAGSYAGYGAWRANLREQFNPDQDPDGPFYELIWFADNEGTIGPEAAADLLEDFHRHEATHVEVRTGEGLYADWTRACELAAADGLIAFH